MESIIAKIQKLLALGERGGTEAEANAAMQKVHELLAKHNLSMDHVAAADLKEDYIQDLTDATFRRPQPWQNFIWSAIAKLYFCEHFIQKSRVGFQHLVIGKRSNIAAVRYVAVYLIRTGEALAREAAIDSDSRQTFINSFKKGFATRICGRVNDEIRKAREGKMTDSTTGTALVVLPLYDRSKQEIQRFLMDNNMHPRTRNSRMDVSNHQGFYAGREAANGISLTANGVEGGKRAAIAGKIL